MVQRIKNLRPKNVGIAKSALSWERPFSSGDELLYLFTRNNPKSFYGWYEGEEPTTVYDWCLREGYTYANSEVYDDQGNVVYYHRYGYGKINNEDKEENRRYDIFYNKNGKAAYYHRGGKIYDRDKKELKLHFYDKQGNEILSLLVNPRIEHKTYQYFFVPDFDLDMNPENLLAYIYQLKKIRDENPDKEIRIKPFGSKRTNMLLLAYQIIFFDNLNIKRYGKDIPIGRSLKGLDERDKNRIQKAIDLHNDLTKDLKNTRRNFVIKPVEQKERSKKLKTPSQSKANYIDKEFKLTINDYINEFNEYIQKKKPLETKTIPIGDTQLSSLKFKNYIVHQPAFEDLLIASKDKNLPKSVRKIIQKSIIDKIRNATDDKWLDQLLQGKWLHKKYRSLKDLIDLFIDQEPTHYQEEPSYLKLLSKDAKLNKFKNINSIKQFVKGLVTNLNETCKKYIENIEKNERNNNELPHLAPNYINDTSKIYKIHIFSKEAADEVLFETKAREKPKKNEQTTYLKRYRSSYIWLQDENKLYYVRNNGVVFNTNIPDDNIDKFKIFLDQRKDLHQPTIIHASQNELKNFEDGNQPKRTYPTAKLKTSEHKNALRKVASTLQMQFLKQDWERKKTDIRLITLLDNESISQDILNLAKRQNTPIVIRQVIEVNGKYISKYSIYGDQDGRGHWKKTPINNPSNELIEFFKNNTFDKETNEIIQKRRLFSGKLLLKRVFADENPDTDFSLTEMESAWCDQAEKNNDPIFLRKLFKIEENKYSDMYFYLERNHKKWKPVELDLNTSDGVEKTPDEVDILRKLYNKQITLDELQNNLPEALKKFPQFKNNLYETIIPCEKYNLHDLPKEIKEHHTSSNKRTMYAAKIIGSGSQNRMIPTPIKIMMDKLDAASKYNAKYSLEQTLKQITALALLESGSTKNTQGEINFYTRLSEFINIDETFKNIENKILNTNFKVYFKYKKIKDENNEDNNKRFPVTIYKEILKKVEQDDEFDRECNPTNKLREILQTAKNKSEEMSLFRLFRDNKTQKFYENITDLIVLNSNADLKNIVDQLKLHTEIGAKKEYEATEIYNDIKFTEPEDLSDVPFNNKVGFTPYDPMYDEPDPISDESAHLLDSPLNTSRNSPIYTSENNTETLFSPKTRSVLQEEKIQKLIAKNKALKTKNKFLGDQIEKLQQENNELKANSDQRNKM